MNQSGSAGDTIITIAGFSDSFKKGAARILVLLSDRRNIKRIIC